MSLRPLQGAAAPFLMTGLGVALLCGLDAIVKGLAEAYGVGETVTLRYLAGALWSVAIWLAWGAPRPTIASLKANAFRAAVVILTALTFFYALSRLPLAETITLAFTSPIFMALLGRTILGEHVPRSVAFGIALGFAGVIVIFVARAGAGSDGAAALDGVLAALASAFFYALSMVLLRKQTAHDPIVTIILLQNVIAFGFAIPIGAATWTMVPAARDLALALLAGALGTLGHLAMAWGYARAEAARLGALEYTAFLWASLLGWAVFDETPGVWVFAGGALIVAGAALAARRAKAAPVPVVADAIVREG